MRLRRIALAVLAGLGAAALLRRQRFTRREHVDLYYDDGSMISLEDGSMPAERLLALARDGLPA